MRSPGDARSLNILRDDEQHECFALAWKATHTDDIDVARINSASATHSSGWLLPRGTDLCDPWLTGAEFVTLCKLRLGQPVAWTDRACNLCRDSIADNEGHLKCLGMGLRTHMHDQVRNVLCDIANVSHFSAQREVNCFPSDPGLRVDVFLRDSTRGRVAVDISIVHIQSTGSLCHAAKSACRRGYGSSKRHGCEVREGRGGRLHRLRAHDF